MYTPKHFEETRLDVLQQLVRDYPLGSLVTFHNNQLNVDHIPFLMTATAGTNGVLHGHVARSNPLWQSPAGEFEAVVIFQGPQTYISPAWYPSKQQHGKAVPTWNYVVVHAFGHLRSIDDPAWLLNHLHELTTTHETGQSTPWSVDDAPRDYIASMLKAIVGIEIPVARFEGKWKVSQNRSISDRLGVIAALETSKQESSLRMADLIRSSAKPESDTTKSHHG